DWHLVARRARGRAPVRASDHRVLRRLLLGEDHPCDDNRLHSVRADYLARLRDRYRTLDDQLLELAKTGTHLFGPALGLTAAAYLSSILAHEPASERDAHSRGPAVYLELGQHLADVDIHGRARQDQVE